LLGAPGPPGLPGLPGSSGPSGFSCAPDSLVEVPIGRLFSEAASFSPLRLVIGSRYKIEVERGFDSETLHRLLHVLEG
jgi:hypothetical protein